ncbi:meckelin isoform X1 [Rhopalosiphum padi]|uniref:meckelin isoform X1 n=1 Tax=Rhopalosiphum padi TaxID=40932 RepID=UPI00298DBBBE|nr:meckelin isoform X1 [Rhopalosiphum padi]
MEFYYLIIILSFVKFCLSNREIVTFITPENCSDREYFVPSLMSCIQCNDYQKSSLDRLSCVCEKNSRIVGKVLEFSCEPCPSNLTATSDHLHCLKKTNVSCGLKNIELETEPNGLPLTQKSCIRCSPGTFPSFDRTKCLPCQVANCTCPQTSHEWLLDGTLCVFSQNLTSWPDERETHTVEYDVVGVDVESKYLKKHLRAFLYKCVKMKHRMSCESLGNLCAIQMYKDERKVNPCRVFKDYRRIPTSSDADRLPLPWIYYGEGDASIAMNRKKITSKYSIRPGSNKSKLKLVAARYNLNGSFIKVSEVSPVELQLCPGLWNGIESAFRFGARYFHTCNIPAKQLIGQGSTEPIFYDFYLQYDDGKKSMLYAIPLLVRNIKVGTTYPNKGRDTSQWLLTRRMFLMDLFSGYSIKTQGLPTVIQYLKTIKLVVQAQREIENEGNIYPPFMVLEYGQITDENISSNELCPVTFTVEFYMENDILHYVDMSLGILSGCVFIWSCIHTWSESKRCGRMAIDLWTVGQFAITCCSHFANMIFVVCLLLAIHTLFFYKAQSVVYILLPSQDLEAVVNRYIIIAFILKIVEIVRLIWKQTNIDIFLVDWEKPRILSNQKQNGIMATQKQTVSIWRSYFVANEWAEIQTKRKISSPLQLLLTILLLKIYGLENWAAAEPEVHLTKVPYRPISQLLGFGMLVIVFSIVYIVQWITTVAIYERYIKNCIQQFVDICSLANISVFILSAEFFGYYIHGRSAHGFSDTDMESLIGQLRREEDNMVRHRGLMPGTDNQTFEMTVPSSLKTYYRRVMAPLNSIQSKQLSGSSFRIKKVDKMDMVKIGQAYNNMNKFLAAFLDHALKDLDYEIREKTFVEKLLGIEYSDPLDKGVFFIDDGHSFDQVIFYGNECTLVIFDLMMLSFFYVLTENIVLAAIITGFLIKIMSVIRTTFGKRNLAKKTLIDERFLI